MTRGIFAALLISCSTTLACGRVLDGGGADSDADNTNACVPAPFGEGGVALYASPAMYAPVMTIQADGKILAMSQSTVARFHANAALDESFGVSGVVTLPTIAGDDGADPHTAIVVAPSQRIVLAKSGSPRSVVFRVDGSGALDTTFGSGGSSDELESTFALITAMAALPDDSIIIAGVVNDGPTDDLDVLLAKYDASGHLDASFGSGGVVRRDLHNGSSDIVEHLLVDASGRILVGGCTQGMSVPTTLAILRYDSSGKPDTSFGVQGLSEVPLATGYICELLRSLPTMLGLEIGLADTIVTGSTGYPPKLARLTSSGEIDATFQQTGITGFDIRNAMSVTSNGSVLVTRALQDQDAGFNLPLFAVERYRPNGTLDTSFGDGGMRTLTFPNQWQANPWQQRLVPDGLVVAGWGSPVMYSQAVTFNLAKFPCVD